MHTFRLLAALIVAGIFLSSTAAYAGATLAITSINGVAAGTAYVSPDAQTLTVMGQSIDPLAGVITLSVTDGSIVLTATSTPLDDGLFVLSVDASAFADGSLALTLTDENGGSDSDAQAGIAVVKDTASPGVSDVRIASNNTALSSFARQGDTVTLYFTSTEQLAIVDIVINGTGALASTMSTTTPYAYTADYEIPADAAEGAVSFNLTYTDASGSGASVSETDDGSSVQIDLSGPVITLNGAASLEIEIGSSYVEQGASATDASGVDGEVLVTGVLDTTTLGAYALTYTALDLLGHTSTTTRTVTVVEPVSGGGGGGGGSRSTRAAEEPEESLEPETAPASVEPEGEVLGATAYSFTRYLRQGDTGEDVTELQALLAMLGYFTEASTGYFGPVTAAALSAYQSAYGLEPVGYIGPKTLALLNVGAVAEDPRIPLLLAELKRLQAEIAKLAAAQ